MSIVIIVLFTGCGVKEYQLFQDANSSSTISQSQDINLSFDSKIVADDILTVNIYNMNQKSNIIKKEIQEIHIDKELEEYIVNLIFATRKPQEYGLNEIEKYLQFGASPRATIDMFKAVKAKAYLRGNDYVSPVDIALIFKDVLRHRIILSYEAQALSVNPDEILQKIIKKVVVP